MNRTVLPLVAFVTSLVLFASAGVYLFVKQQQTSDQVNQITKVVHTATCGGGHSKENLAACHRLCPNLESISNLRCDPKEVMPSTSPSSGNSRPGGTKPPSSGLNTTKPPSQGTGTGADQGIVKEIVKPIVNACGALCAPAEPMLDQLP